MIPLRPGISILLLIIIIIFIILLLLSGVECNTIRFDSGKANCVIFSKA